MADDPQKVEHVQNLRRGSAAQPHRNRKKYRRKRKHKKRDTE